MSWRDQLRTVTLSDGRQLVGASFRGAVFLVHSSEGTVGRRTVVHEFPLRDQPEVEDMGRSAETITLDGYVIGPNYMADRDALIRALRESGPGALVHPYLGELTVALSSPARYSESTAEGGMARFALSFVEAAEISYPQTAVATQAAVSGSVLRAAASAEAVFTAEFSVASAPAYVANAAIDNISAAISSVRAALNSVASLPAEATELAASLTSLAAEASALVLAPVDLAGRLTGALDSLRAAAARPEAAVLALRQIFGFGADLDAVPETTPTRQQQAGNQTAFADLLRQAAVLQAVQASSEIDFSGLDDALSLRDELLDELDTLAESAATDTLYYALAEARAAMAADISARGAQLQRLITLTLPESAPALAVAYALYGDAGRDAEIIARNHLSDPLFVPGARPLEFLGVPNG